MPMPNIPLPAVWDVPVAAGVPALLGQSIGSGLSASVSNLLGQTVASVEIQNAEARWGVFTAAGYPALTAAHVLGVEFESSYQIADAPTENGGFTSYNKIRVPYTARVILVCDGTEEGFGGLTQDFMSVLSSLTGDAPLNVRRDFFNTLETIVADTNLYTIVTPERSYAKANIVGYRFRRSSEGGITMPVVEIALQEVRNNATLGYTNTTRTPAGAAQVQLGTVQAQEVTSSIAKNYNANQFTGDVSKAFTVLPLGESS